MTKKPGPCPGTGGRPLKHKQFHPMVTNTINYSKMNGFAAISRYCNVFARSCGGTLKEIKLHLEETVLGLKDARISRKNIHHLMVPPRKNSKTANLYKGLIKARIPKKKNHMKSDHQDLHFCRFQAGYFFDAAELFKEDAI